jgi:uncharacterized RDD family membrane protein YckC
MWITMAVSPRYQTFGQRLFAGFFDSLVFVPLIIVNGLILRPDRPIGLLGAWIGVSELLYFVYSVILHAKYGQTLGKMITHVKVLDHTESGVPGFRRAFLRDSFYIATTLGGIAHALWLFFTEGAVTALHLQVHQSISYAMLWWFVLELGTMFTNERRRSLHDFIGGTVVVDSRCEDIPGRINPITLPGAKRGVTSPVYPSADFENSTALSLPLPQR